MLVKYELIKNTYYKNGATVDESDVKLDLPKQVFQKLLNEKVCKIREESIEKSRNKNKKELDILNKAAEKENKKNQKLLDKYKEKYHISMEKYKGTNKLGLFRKNDRLGFYNFVTYLENDSKAYVDNLILKDIKEQIELSKNK